MITGIWTYIAVAVAIGIALVIITFALIIAWRLIRGDIDLTYLLSEPADPNSQRRGGPDEPPETPKASISRFQFLIFTFVIAGV
jgi:hypothetical protein